MRITLHYAVICTRFATAKVGNGGALITDVMLNVGPPSCSHPEEGMPWTGAPSSSSVK